MKFNFFRNWEKRQNKKVLFLIIYAFINMYLAWQFSGTISTNRLKQMQRLFQQVDSLCDKRWRWKTLDTGAVWIYLGYCLKQSPCSALVNYYYQLGISMLKKMFEVLFGLMCFLQERDFGQNQSVLLGNERPC